VSSLRSLDQRRAASAYAYAATAPKKAAELAIRLPAMFQINGFLATWAFLLAKEGKKEPTPVAALLDYLRSLQDLKVPQGDSASVFLHWVGGATGAAEGVDGSRLRALTAEALAWSVWLKRAAEARGETGDGHG
jgi:CRISPR/Cas system CMR-associated protein Cmr5 small subunit